MKKRLLLYSALLLLGSLITAALLTFLYLELILQTIADQYEIKIIKLKGIQLGYTTGLEYIEAHYRDYTFQLSRARIKIGTFTYPDITAKSLTISVPGNSTGSSNSSQQWKTDYLTQETISAIPFGSIQIDELLGDYAGYSFELENLKVFRTREETTASLSAITRFDSLCQTTNWSIPQLVSAATSSSHLPQPDFCEFPQIFLLTLSESKSGKSISIQSQDKFTLTANIKGQDLETSFSMGMQALEAPMGIGRANIRIKNLASPEISEYTLDGQITRGNQSAELVAEGQIIKSPLTTTADAGARLGLRNFTVSGLSAQETLFSLEDKIVLSSELKDLRGKVTIRTKGLKINSQEADLRELILSKGDTITLQLEQFSWRPLSNLFRSFSVNLTTVPDFPLLAISGSLKSGQLQATTKGTINLAKPSADFSLTIPQHHLRQERTLEDLLKKLPVKLNLTAGSISGNIKIFSANPFISINLSALNADGEFYDIPFAQMTTNLQISGLTALKTTSELKIGQLTTPIPISDIRLFFSVDGFDKNMVVTLNSVSGKILGGEIKLERGVYRPFSAAAQHFNIDLYNISLAEVMKFSGQEPTTASGLINISLPLKIEGTRLSVEEGRLNSVGPGKISIPSSSAKDQSSPAIRALENFVFSSLSGKVEYEPTGRLKLSLKIEGKNPDLLRGQQFVFNVNVEQNLLKLLGSLKDPLKRLGTADFSKPR